jgi:hypothetical protein
MQLYLSSTAKINREGKSFSGITEFNPEMHEMA